LIFFQCTPVDVLPPMLELIPKIGMSLGGSCWFSTKTVNKNMSNLIENQLLKFSMKVDAFNSCMSLERLYFTGDAPELDSTDCESNSLETCRPEIYYLKEAKGWGDTFGGAPTREFFDDPFFSELSKQN